MTGTQGDHVVRYRQLQAPSSLPTGEFAQGRFTRVFFKLRRTEMAFHLGNILSTPLPDN